MSDKTDVTPAPAKKFVRINGRKVNVTNGRCKVSAVKNAVGKGDSVKGGKMFRGKVRSNFDKCKGDKKFIPSGKVNADGNRYGDSIAVDTLKRLKIVS